MGDFLDEMTDQVPALRRYALALTQNRDLADDLVQDCLERAIRKRRLWRPSGSLKSWLFKIMINVNKNRLRKKQPTDFAGPIDEDSGMQAPPSQISQIALAQTARALEKLPEDQKQILTLVVLQDMSYREVADILNIPQGTVMSRLSRARRNLSKLAEDQSPAEPGGHLRTVK